MQEPKDFFISYNKADHVWAVWLAWQLEEAGYTTVLQAWDFRVGSNFILGIDKAVRTAKRIIVLLSPDYLSALYTQPEWASAFGRDPTSEKGILVPIRVRTCELEGLLAAIVYIDLTECDELQAQHKLLTGLANNRTKPTSKPDFPRGKPTVKPIFPGEQQHSIVETPNSSQVPSNKPIFPGEQQHSIVETPNSSQVPSKQDAVGTTLYTYDIHSNWISTVAWSHDGTRIASGGGDKLVRVWDAYTGRNYVTYRGHWGPFMAHVWDAKWSPDGSYIASCGFGTTVRVWDATTGKDIVLYNGHGSIDPLLETLAVTWSPDGTRIASACNFGYANGTIDIWDALTGRMYLRYTGHSKRLRDLVFVVSALAWSPNGQYIASSGTDKTAKNLHLDTTKGDKTLQIWNAETGQHMVTCKSAFDWVNDLSWSPDSRYIASAESEKLVRIWDAENGKQVLSYQGHTQKVRAVAWSPDGACVASASNDRTVHLWQPATSKLLYVYRGHTSEVTALAWSPNGKHIASASSDKTVQVWKAR